MIERKEFYKKIEQMKARVGMFVPSPVSYNVVHSFIDGMDYQSGGCLLDGFDDWLRKKYNLKSSLHWGAYILYVLEEQGLYLDEEGKIDMLFELILRFVSEKD